jgi:hypothetical protein
VPRGVTRFNFIAHTLSENENMCGRNANVSMGEETKESRIKLIEIEMKNDLKTHLDC